MNSLEKIIFFLSFNSEGKYPKAISDKLASLNVFLLFYSLVLAGFSYSYHVSEVGLITRFTFLSVLICLFDWVFVFKTKNVNIGSGIFLIVILVQYFLNFFLYFDRLFVLIFIFSIPIISLFLFGFKKNTIINFFVFASTLSIYTYSNSFSEVSYLDFKVNSITLLIFIWFITSILFLITKHNSIVLEAELNNANKIIKERNNFISSLSLQFLPSLKNINTAISFFAQSDLIFKHEDLLDSIKASSSNLIAVVNSINNITNFKTESLFEEKKFDIKKTLNNTFSLYTSSKEKSFILNTQFTEKLPNFVIGQPVKLKQIIFNIIEFYIKFYPKDKHSVVLNFLLSINKVQEDKVILSFEFKSETPLLLDIENFNLQNKISGKEHFDYLITRSLIESSKGSMNFLSNPFETTFSFTLECTKADIKQNINSKPNTEVEVKTASRNKKIEYLRDSVVLIVEDNLINQKIMVLSLKKLVNEIVIANNGQEALDAMKTNNFNIILMDIQMPVMDGLEASMRIRKNENDVDQIPIIAITANALHGDRESCLAAGMNDYISKPFKLEVLLEKMKYHLNVTD